MHMRTEISPIYHPFSASLNSGIDQSSIASPALRRSGSTLLMLRTAVGGGTVLATSSEHPTTAVNAFSDGLQWLF